jgi:Protein of unknown function (DUF3102)
MDMTVVPSQQTDIALAEHAAVIRALGKRMVADIVEVGRRLTEAKRIAGHGNWLPWLEKEFGWSSQTADNFVHVFEATGKFPKFGNLSLPISGLYLLAAPSTPDDAREEVIARVETGERLSLAEVQRLVEEARVTEAAKIEKRIAELQEIARNREETIRSSYTGKLVLEPEVLERQLSNAIAGAQRPLLDKIASLEKKLAKSGGEAKPAAEPDSARRKEETEAEEKSKRDAFLRLTEAAYRGTTSWADPAFVQSVQDRLTDTEFRKELVKWLRFNPNEIEKIKPGAAALVDVLSTLTNGDF